MDQGQGFGLKNDRLKGLGKVMVLRYITWKLGNFPMESDQNSELGAYVKYTVFFAKTIPMVALWTGTKLSGKVYGP